MNEFDRLIKLHAERLQRVYDERTAGDFTFSGALANFLVDIERARLDETIERIKATEKEHPIKHVGVNYFVQERNTPLFSRSTMCRCGDYFATSEADLDEHVAAMMLVNDGKSHG